MTYDFIIFGNGLSSKALALAMSNLSFKTLIINPKTEKVTSENLVTFISDGSLKYLSSILESKDLLEESEEIKQIMCEHILNSRKSRINFIDQNKKSLGRIISNNNLNKIFENEISQRKDLVDIINIQPCNFRTEENYVHLLQNDNILHSAKLLFFSSMDKNNPIVKPFNFVNKNLNQVALSISAQLSRSKKNCAYQIFTEDGPIALLPINDYEASIVWSLKNNSKILKYDENKIQSHLMHIFSNYINNVKIETIQKYPLKFSYAKKLYTERVVLIGNIAHNIHPIAGQGFNLTIKDISKISSLMKKYKSLGYDLGDKQILEIFSNYRKFDNFKFSFGTLSMEEIFSNKNKIVRLLTGKSFRLLDKSEKIKNYFIKEATGQFNS